jgi:hypothetical protein
MFDTNDQLQTCSLELITIHQIFIIIQSSKNVNMITPHAIGKDHNMFGEKIQEFKKRLVVPTLNLKSKPKP